ncbi:hypothetical protein SAMN05421772_1113 [Paracoccus saliphilus]|uniref:Uncharacterized protein n=1 Tax=Paracoccus saliphilus TaxID=405559 RepID=A0AA45W607_9RHOB|nr:hypothetical protein SAMN05421772_1113 [Paracoccus saliphilus]
MGRPRAAYTKTDIRRAVQGAREADPMAVVEVVLGEVTLRILPPETPLDECIDNDKLGLPKQW